MRRYIIYFFLPLPALPFLAKAALRFANGSGFAFLPAFLCAAATFLAALLVDTSGAFRFATASYGLSCNMALTFFNGFILKADSVQIQNLPTWPPGANFKILRLSTEIVST